MINDHEDERLITAFSTHWVKYVPPVLIYTLLLAVSLLLFSLAGIAAHHSAIVTNITFFAGLILMLLVHHWFFHMIMSEAMVDVIITSRRIIFLQDRLWLYDDMHEITLDTVRGVQARKRGILQNLLRYGSLWFDTGGTDVSSSQFIPLVPHPHRQAKAIVQLLRMK